MGPGGFQCSPHLSPLQTHQHDLSTRHVCMCSACTQAVLLGWASPQGWPSPELALPRWLPWRGSPGGWPPAAQRPPSPPADLDRPAPPALDCPPPTCAAAQPGHEFAGVERRVGKRAATSTAGCFRRPQAAADSRDGWWLHAAARQPGHKLFHRCLEGERAVCEHGAACTQDGVEGALANNCALLRSPLLPCNPLPQALLLTFNLEC